MFEPASRRSEGRRLAWLGFITQDRDATYALQRRDVRASAAEVG